MPSTPGTWTRAIIRALDARGIDGRALAAAVGVDLGRLRAPDARVPIATNAQLWRRATQATADPCFGLYASRFVEPLSYLALCTAVAASLTLREAFDRIVRDARLIGDGARARLESGHDRVRLILDIVPGIRPADEGIDALFSLGVRVARRLHDSRDLRPLRVELKRPEPAAPEPFRRFFRGPIEFGAGRNVLEFAQRDMSAALPYGNAQLSRSVDHVLARSIGQHQTREIVSQVRSVVLGRLANGEPTKDAIAHTLGMSSRTLQRRLAYAGTSFQSVLSDTRLELARTYLIEGMPMIQIAEALGFCDASSFSRAFRRWTGRSPSEARRVSASTALGQEQRTDVA